MHFAAVVVSFCVAASLSANFVSAQAPTDWSDDFDRAWDWLQQSHPSGVPTDIQNALETARENFASQSLQIPTITHTLAIPTDLINKISTNIINQLPTEFNKGPPNNKNKSPDDLGDSDLEISTNLNKSPPPSPMIAPTGSNKSVPTELPKDGGFSSPGENKNPAETANKIGPTGVPDTDEPSFDDERSGPPFDDERSGLPFDDERSGPPFEEKGWFVDDDDDDDDDEPGPDGPPQLWRPALWRPGAIKAWEMYREEMTAENIEDPAELWAMRQHQIKEEKENAPHVADIKKAHEKVEEVAPVENTKDAVPNVNAFAANALEDTTANPTASPSVTTIGGMQPGTFYALIAAAAVCVVVLIVGAVSYGIISRSRNKASGENVITEVGSNPKTSDSEPPEASPLLGDQNTPTDIESQTLGSRTSLDSNKDRKNKGRIVLS